MNIVNDPEEDKLKDTHAALQAAVLQQLSATIKDPKTFAQTIVNEAIADFKKDAKNVLLKLAGFKNSWGKLEVDHCNGRSGGSAIGDIAKNDFKGEALKFIDENKDSIFCLTVTEKKEIIDALREEFKSSLNYAIHYETKNQINSFLNEEVNLLIKEFKDNKILKVAMQISDSK